MGCRQWQWYYLGTASAPASGLFGLVDTFDATSAETYAVISERGTPSHKKLVSRQAPV